MHVLIINGSPRVKQYSNTDKILEKITAGLSETGCTFEQYEVSDRKQWDRMREAFDKNENILIALPLYVECIPGLLMEFLETVTPKTDGSKLAFILQSGFAEGIQLRCGEEYLEMLAERMGCKYVGTLVKGDNFSIRMFEGKQQERLTLRYKEMGVEFGKEGNFLSEKCRAFTGPEVFSAPMRIFIGIMFKTVVKNGFKNTSLKWGCTKPLDYRPY